MFTPRHDVISVVNVIKSYEYHYLESLGHRQVKAAIILYYDSYDSIIMQLDHTTIDNVIILLELYTLCYSTF